MKRQTLGEELAELERTDPAVAAAAASFERVKRQVIEGRIHRLPCRDESCQWHHETDARDSEAGS